MENLQELYCQYNNWRLKDLYLDNCNSLRTLDAAENAIEELDISNLKNLDFVSLKGCVAMNYLNINDCPLTFLDFTGCVKLADLNLDGCGDSIRKLYFSEEAANPEWKTFPNLEKVGIYKHKEIDEEIVHFVDEIDVLAIRNTKNIQNILANPNNYSWNDLDNIDKKDLYGVPTDLRDKLISLIVEKFNEKIREEFKLPDEEENKRKNPPKQEEDTPEDEEEPAPQTPPPPKRRKSESEEPEKQNKDQIINDLHEENEKLKARIRELENSSKTQDSKQVEKIKKEIEKTKEEINNSGLSKEQKEELLKLLEKLDNKNRTVDYYEEKIPSSYNYNLVWIPVLIGQTILLSALVYAYWCDWKRVVRKEKT